MGDFDELEEIAEQNKATYDGRDRRGRKLGHGNWTSRKTQSRGRFKRIKKKNGHTSRLSADYLRRSRGNLTCSTTPHGIATPSRLKA